jgi:hypothetical protein
MLLDLAQRARGVLPQGSPLPEPAWRLRHQVILWVLALHAVGVFGFGVVRGFGPAHSLLEASPLAVTAWLASRPRFGRRVRAALATLGLLTASAVLVHLSEGQIEFVETQAVLDCLRELGVDYAQGYAISRPRPLAERLATAGPTAPRVAAGTTPA